MSCDQVLILPQFHNHHPAIRGRIPLRLHPVSKRRHAEFHHQVPPAQLNFVRMEIRILTYSHDLPFQVSLCNQACDGRKQRILFRNRLQRTRLHRFRSCRLIGVSCQIQPERRPPDRSLSDRDKHIPRVRRRIARLWNQQWILLTIKSDHLHVLRVLRHVDVGRNRINRWRRNLP